MSLSNLAAEMGLAGTTAVIVVNFTHPIDTYKTRLQVNPQFSVGAMVREEGVASLYKGIAPAWMREATYTSMKLGLYGPLKKVFGGEEKDTPFHLKFLSGSTAGVLGSFVGNPFDVLKTLQMTNKGVNEGMIAMTSKLVGERGVAGLYRGVQANAMRACVLNGTKMACYDEVKGVVVKASGWKRNDLRTQFCAAAGAGLAMAITVSPFDRMRTLLMNQGQTKQYSGFMDCLTKTVAKEGPLSLWRGFFPIWARFAPQATGQLIVFEFLRKLAGMDTI